MAQHFDVDVVLERYASASMVELFSSQKKIQLWRELWIALASAQKELGLNISKVQIDELKENIAKVNWKLAKTIEKEIRHDVMAHVKTYAKQCPKAAPIIHLGATSAFVTDNADIIRIKEGLTMIAGKLSACIDKLATFALKEKDTATLAFTHFQAAQPTTVGKRVCLWIMNFVMDMELLEFEQSQIRFHGVKGATGTQDSFLKLFDGDEAKVLKLDQMVCEKMGFEKTYPVTGQTYPRKFDSRILSILAGICESANKFATDMRLLQALHEISEPKESMQVGSSAMPYKQNPMRSERICSLARYVIHLLPNAYDTASHQWFERTLDDSANRRIVLPHAFLVCDAVLELVLNIASGMRINHEVIANHLDQALPFMQTEEILMAAVKEGGDRQKLHESIRKHANDVAKNVYEKGQSNDLLSRIRTDKDFDKISPKLLVKADPSRLVGMAPKQVQSFINEHVEPIRKAYRSSIQKVKTDIRV